MRLITAIAHKIGHNGGSLLEVSRRPHHRYGQLLNVLYLRVILRAAIEDLVGGAIT